MKIKVKPSGVKVPTKQDLKLLPTKQYIREFDRVNQLKPVSYKIRGKVIDP